MLHGGKTSSPRCSRNLVASLTPLREAAREATVDSGRAGGALEPAPCRADPVGQQSGADASWLRGDAEGISARRPVPPAANSARPRHRPHCQAGVGARRPLPQVRVSARSARYHRAEIREFAGFRESTDADAQALADWVQRTLAPEDHRMEHLRDAVLERCRQLRVEPPSPGRVERLIRSGLHAFETQFFAETLQRLPPSTRSHLDRLLAREDEEAPDGSDATGTPSWWVKLRQDPGPVGIKSARAEIDKLQALRGIGLPGDLFAGVARRVLDGYRQRATAERPAELRSHPEATGYSLVAAFCKLRAEEVTDNLVELLIHIIHKIGARAEKKVVTELLEDFQQVTGKAGMLYRLAEAAIDNPDGVVREVLFPVVGEQTLKDLVREHKSTGSAYRTHVHIRMRASYGRHYRQILPKLLAALEFASSNEVYRPRDPRPRAAQAVRGQL